jgi:hypothetical protein
VLLPTRSSIQELLSLQCPADMRFAIIQHSSFKLLQKTRTNFRRYCQARAGKTQLVFIVFIAHGLIRSFLGTLRCHYGDNISLNPNKTVVFTSSAASNRKLPIQFCMVPSTIALVCHLRKNSPISSKCRLELWSFLATFVK